MTLRLPRTLTARILLAEIAAILVVAVLLPLLLVSVLHDTASLSENGDLRTQAGAIARGLHRDADGQVRIRLAPDQAPGYAEAYDGRAYAVVGTGYRVAAASRYAAAVPWRRVALGRVALFARAGVFHLASVPVTFEGRPAWVLVSQDETQPGVILDDVMRGFLARYLLVLLPVLLLLPIVNSLLVRRLVTSARAVAERAAAIGPATLDVRLDETALPAEIVPLVAATNRLVARLEESFNRQSEFVANVVHELRTPLSTLLVQLDGIADPVARAPLVRQVERLSHVVSQLRSMAALEAAHATAIEAIDLTTLATATVAEMAPGVLAGGRTIALIADDAPAIVMGNATLIAVALANLIGNAARHTPAGTAIAVELRRGAAVTLTVRDDGPGIAAGAEPTRRFWRADHGRSDSAGLGLAIVRRVAEVHDARLTIGANVPRGAVVSLAFRANG